MSETTDGTTKQQDMNSGTTAAQSQDPQELSSDKDIARPKTSLEKYCDDNPSASECLIYEE